MISTTLNRIREYPHDVYPYLRSRDWEKLLAGLGKTKPDDRPLPYADILRICGLDYAIWTLRAEPKHANKMRLLAIRFAKDVEHLMTDPRSIAALDAADRHARYGLCDMDLIKAKTTAWRAVPSSGTLTGSTKLAAHAAALAAVATTNIDTNLIERTTRDAARAAARNVWAAVWFTVWGAVNATLEAVPSAWSFACATWEDTHSVLSAARAGARAVSRALEGTAAVSPGWYSVWASEAASGATRYAAEAAGHAAQAKEPDGDAARDTSYIPQPEGADALAALNAAKARQVTYFLAAVGGKP